MGVTTGETLLKGPSSRKREEVENHWSIISLAVEVAGQAKVLVIKFDVWSLVFGADMV